MTTRLTVLAVVLTALLTGCATSQGRREQVYSGTPPPPQTSAPAYPPPVYAPPSPTPGTPSAPQELSPDLQVTPPQNYPKTPQEVSGQAVVSLINQANQERRQSQPDRAAASLERAMRIEPRNCFVWSLLAQVYLDQQNYDQAISVAGKSNSLSHGNPYVELENWKTIAAGKTAQGDSLGALKAQSKVEELQRQIGGG